MADQKKIYSFPGLAFASINLASLVHTKEMEIQEQLARLMLMTGCNPDQIRIAEEALTKDGLLSVPEALDVLERRARKGEPLVRIKR